MTATYQHRARSAQFTAQIKLIDAAFERKIRSTADWAEATPMLVSFAGAVQRRKAAVLERFQQSILSPTEGERG